SKITSISLGFGSFISLSAERPCSPGARPTLGSKKPASRAPLQWQLASDFQVNTAGMIQPKIGFVQVPATVLSSQGTQFCRKCVKRENQRLHRIDTVDRAQDGSSETCYLERTRPSVARLK